MRNGRLLRRLAVAALAPCAAACDTGTEPVLGGEYLGMLDSPFAAEGAALIEITHPDIREVSAPGRILVAQGTTERTVRLMLLNPPRNQNGGPIAFVVRMAPGARPPEAEVLAVAAPNNLARGFVGAYAVRFTRLGPDEGRSPPLPAPPAGPPPPVSWARLVAPFFPGGKRLEPEEEIRVDRAGNGNQVLDLGDVRGYTHAYPGVTPPQTTWSR
ncbi:MAG: hypothetical protein KY467_14900 [Gemmatimonadetes bacterium]|nr:hypothetical protein [Gemmatimonadota bacterium]